MWASMYLWLNQVDTKLSNQRMENFKREVKKPTLLCQRDKERTPKTALFHVTKEKRVSVQYLTSHMTSPQTHPGIINECIVRSKTWALPDKAQKKKKSKKEERG